MKRVIVTGLALLLMAQSAPRATVNDLGWMSGHWLTADAAVEEDWTAPRGDVMLGTGRTVDAGALREYEFLRIQAGADGVPVYWGSPHGGAPGGLRFGEAGAPPAPLDNTG